MRCPQLAPDNLGRNADLSQSADPSTEPHVFRTFKPAEGRTRVQVFNSDGGALSIWEFESRGGSVTTWMEEESWAAELEEGDLFYPTGIEELDRMSSEEHELYSTAVGPNDSYAVEVDGLWNEPEGML